MQDVLSCRFNNLDIGTIKQYHMHSSVSTYGFGLCSIDATATENTTLMSNWVFNVTEESLNNLRRCTEDINPECRQTNYLVVKVIRLTMQELGQLMDLDPDFKVLYLVRDPRGTVRSQNQLGEFDWTILNNYTKSFCERVRSDIHVSKTVFHKFPHRVMQVRYEDIIENPIARTQQLYGFINLEFTPPVKEYIWNITFAGNQDDCNICTTRKNATETAYAWRKVLSFDEVNLIQSHCSDVMKHFGYRPFDQKELSDFKISSYYQVKR
ncbi:carbohydrate sulfotransferase 4-like [Physella acuta]|uniref:carbohydrate sulfotransferase 4-like n=1 Tax=Physella acuta TaxID=109671 RepID=UPI0027DDDFA7|nr:carbohydrate sulfotransferase 4-like [Physella acuta]